MEEEGSAQQRRRRVTEPLLSEHHEPALSSGPSNNTTSTSVEDSSALSRLIAESTPPEALLPFTSTATNTNDETTVDAGATSGTANTNGINRGQASLVTTAAGTLVCLQWGCTWGAYFSKNGWMDSHLQISIGWQSKFLPWLDKHTDFVIQETSVFSLADNLKDDKEYASLAGLWICSVIIPCVFMIVCPIWILTDYTVPRRGRQLQQQQQQQGSLFSRTWLELTIRLSSMVCFIMLTLNIAIAGIELTWADTDLQVHNELRGSYLSYLLGCLCALLVVVVLRMPFLEHLRLLKYPYQTWESNRNGGRRHRHHHHTLSNTNFTTTSSTDGVPLPSPALHSPPPTAFRLPWLSSRHGQDRNTATANDDNEETERLIESVPPLSISSSEPIQTTSPPPRQHQSSPSLRPTPAIKISFFQKMVLFQTGVLAFLLWFPALVLAQFRVLYDGLVVDVLKLKSFNVHLWQFPHIIWHTGIQSGTPPWIMILSFAIIGLLVVVLPLTAHVVAVSAWIRPRARQKLRDVLLLLHPTLCGIPLAVGIVVTVPSFIDIGEDLDADICTQIERVIQNQCLISGGIHLAGCWFLLAQAIALEIFVALTIRWTGPPKNINRNIVV